MRQAHAQHNRTISSCVSQWCNMTQDFRAIAEAADSIQDMGTYHANSLENFVSKLNLTAGVPRDKLYVGMGFGGGQNTKFQYETTERGLTERFAALSSAGVRNVAMFELVSASRMSSWNLSSAWWSQLEQWTASAEVEAVVEDLPVGDSVHQVEHGGRLREFHVFVPPSARRNPAGLAIYIHGFTHCKPLRSHFAPQIDWYIGF